MLFASCTFVVTAFLVTLEVPFVWAGEDGVSASGFSALTRSRESQQAYVPWGYFHIVQTDSGHKYFSPFSKDDPIQLIFSEDDDESWCNAAVCLGRYKNFGMVGLPIENGWKITLAADSLNGDQIICPFDTMTPEVTAMYCHSNALISHLNSVTIGARAGPFLGDLEAGGPCGTDGKREDFEVWEISCTASDEDFATIMAALEDADREERSLNVKNKPESSKQMMVWPDSGGAGFWVDPLKYTLKLADKDDDEDGACTGTSCYGGNFIAYVIGPDRSKIEISLGIANDLKNPNLWTVACPYGHQTPSIAKSVCYNDDRTEAGTGIFDGEIIAGPIMFNFVRATGAPANACDGSVTDQFVTLSIECTPAVEEDDDKSCFSNCKWFNLWCWIKNFFSCVLFGWF